MPASLWGVASARSQGAKVAEVRYRAWSTPSSLYPSICVQAHLRLMWWTCRAADRWVDVPLAPPIRAGLSYEDDPVNVAAAALRRASRFAANQTSGPLELVGVDTQIEVAGTERAEFPVTLDLRRYLLGCVSDLPSESGTDAS